MYIIDALIGNFDRHGSNWGFIKKGNSYQFSPIFDNGSSLFPRRNTEELMREVMESPDKIQEITFRYPTSQIRLNNKKSSYFDVIHSLAFVECNNALVRIFERIDLKKIFKLIDIQDELTTLQRQFYKFIIEYRYEQILKASYKKLRGTVNG